MLVGTVSKTARAAAYNALKNHAGSVPDHGTLIVVDFTQPSQTRRFEVIDLKNKKVNSIASSHTVENPARSMPGSCLLSFGAVQFIRGFGRLQFDFPVLH